MKSQLKVIEAGFYKKALIASEIGPYTIDLVHCLKNGDEFLRILLLTSSSFLCSPFSVTNQIKLRMSQAFSNNAKFEQPVLRKLQIEEIV